MFFTFDNKNIYASSNLNGRDKSAIVEYDITAGKEVKEILRMRITTWTNWITSKRKVITMVSWTGAKSEHAFLDKRTETLWNKLGEQMKGYDRIGYMVRMMMKTNSWSGRATIACRVNTTSTTKADKTTEMATLYPWSNENDLAEMKPSPIQKPRWT